MNFKRITTTLALLGSGALALSGCEKGDAPSTEVPGGDAANPVGDAAGEATCAADDHPAEGHCGADAAGGDDMGGEEAADGGEEAADGGEEAAEGE